MSTENLVKQSLSYGLLDLDEHSQMIDLCCVNVVDVDHYHGSNDSDIQNDSNGFHGLSALCLILPYRISII
jgi:hypothetical protein